MIQQKKQKKNAKKTYNHMIVLDAGHGGIDEGTMSTDKKYDEKMADGEIFCPHFFIPK